MNPRLVRRASKDDPWSAILRGSLAFARSHLRMTTSLVAEADDLDRERLPHGAALMVGARDREQPLPRGNANLGAFQILPGGLPALAGNFPPVIRVVVGNVEDFVGKRLIADRACAGIGGGKAVHVLPCPIEHRAGRGHAGIGGDRIERAALREPPADLLGELLRIERSWVALLARARTLGEEAVMVVLDPGAQRRSRRHFRIASNRPQ